MIKLLHFEGLQPARCDFYLNLSTYANIYYASKQLPVEIKNNTTMEGYFTAFDCKRDATVVGSIRIYYYIALATRHCTVLSQSTEQAISRELSSP